MSGLRAALARLAPRRALLGFPRLFLWLHAPTDRELGELGEEAAARHLSRRGFRILARRLRTRSGEADLVVRTERVLAVVEVKTGRASSMPRPRGAAGLGDLDLRWRPGLRCDARRIRRLRAVLREIGPGAAPRPAVRRVDLVEVFLVEPGRRLRVLHHEALALEAGPADLR